jgi:hypothetical protein
MNFAHGCAQTLFGVNSTQVLIQVGSPFERHTDMCFFSFLLSQPAKAHPNRAKPQLGELA